MGHLGAGSSYLDCAIRRVLPELEVTERDRISALSLAASHATGSTREVLLKSATSRPRDRQLTKDWEISNLRMSAQNPCNLNLRGISPETIKKNIFMLKDLRNPPAELLYTLLAL